MTTRAHAMTAIAWAALGGNATRLESLRFTGQGGLSGAFPVTDFASAAIATAALAVADLMQGCGRAMPVVTVDRRLASFWYAWSIRPQGWQPPALRDPVTGDYHCADGWIRVHANAAHHRAAAQRVLACADSRETVAQAVAHWGKGELEAAIVDSGGCAAQMRSLAQWHAHPQGLALEAEPLVHSRITVASPPVHWPVPGAHPLNGIRVLDLTRILAGPTASRFLAGYGADVLRIDPPGWQEPGVEPEVTLGKRCARLDLHDKQGRQVFETLLAQADVLLSGYRTDALERLGYGAAARRQLNPGLIDVCLNAYGWSGPWANRRGFDSLVQMSCGIAQAGQHSEGADRPLPLPVQALDHATGYLMAATVVRGLARRLDHGHGLEARLSLARTAKWLSDQGMVDPARPLAQETPQDLAQGIETTTWGPARRLKPPVEIDGTPMHWILPASALGSAQAGWQPYAG